MDKHASPACMTRLDNGFRVITQAMPGMASASIGIWVGVGSRYEGDALGGLSHFLEHLLFKGTKKRSAKEITAQIEGIGGHINAFTTEEHTCYEVRVHHRHVREGISILSDMVLHSLLDPKEIERERGVIHEEIAMAKDDPGDYVQELLGERIWPHHPLGRMVRGTHETIAQMKRGQILQYKDTHYVAANMVLACAGNVDHQAVVALANKYFAKAPKGAVPSYARVAETPALKGPNADVFDQKTEQVHVALAFPGFPRRHPDRAAIKLLGTLLGGNMSSRLFQEVREKRGLAYEIGSSVNHFHDTGLLTICAGTEGKKLLSCLEVIAKVLIDFKRGRMTAKEIHRAKEYATGCVHLSLEKTMDRMLWLGETMIAQDEIADTEKILREMHDVDAHDIARLAKALFAPENLCLQAIGPGLSVPEMLKRLEF